MKLKNEHNLRKESKKLFSINNETIGNFLSFEIYSEQ